MRDHGSLQGEEEMLLEGRSQERGEFQGEESDEDQPYLEKSVGIVTHWPNSKQFKMAGEWAQRR